MSHQVNAKQTAPTHKFHAGRSCTAAFTVRSATLERLLACTGRHGCCQPYYNGEKEETHCLRGGLICRGFETESVGRRLAFILSRLPLSWWVFGSLNCPEPTISWITNITDSHTGRNLSAGPHSVSSNPISDVGRRRHIFLLLSRRKLDLRHFWTDSLCFTWNMIAEHVECAQWSS